MAPAQTGPESFTAAQNTSFKSFMKTFFDVFPGGQAFGHMDTDPLNKIDPGFSVEDYILTNFNKRNISQGTSQPATIRDIELHREVYPYI